MITPELKEDHDIASLRLKDQLLRSLEDGSLEKVDSFKEPFLRICVFIKI